MRLGLIFAFFVFLTSSSLAAQSETVGVASVIDGDTIEIHGERIRLFGIDAPEHDQACTDAAGAKYLCGQKAAFALADMLKEKTVHCENRGDGGFGRTLGLCRVGAEDVSAAMVDQGWALAYVDYSKDYVANEARAKDAKLGMWQGPFVNPWDERHGTSAGQSATGQQVTAVATNECLDGCTADRPIKGNISVRGHIYHCPGDPSYCRTKIDMDRSERCFATWQEANAAQDGEVRWRRPLNAPACPGAQCPCPSE